MNNTSSTMQLNLKHTNSTPQHLIEGKNKIFIQNATANLSRIQDQVSLTAKNSTK